MTKTTTCPACHATGDFMAKETIDLAELHTHWAPGDAALQKQLTETATQVAPVYHIVRCEKCGLEFADPLAAPDGRWYMLAYFNPEPFPPTRWDHATVLDSLAPTDTVLEIGCGSGSFLQKCGKRQVSASGVDLSEESVRQCRELGLAARVLDLRHDEPGESAADATAVAAFQVLEHLDCPDRMFTLAQRHSAGGANLWIAVPSDRRPARLLGERDFRDEPPHHMTRWTEAALRALGARNGWALAELQYESITPSAAVWWLTTRSAWYRKLEAKGRLRNALVERLARLLAFPAIFLSYRNRYRKMSGFNMLARFRKLSA